jgi:hypothetical protein
MKNLVVTAAAIVVITEEAAAASHVEFFFLFLFFLFFDSRSTSATATAAAAAAAAKLGELFGTFSNDLIEILISQAFEQFCKGIGVHFCASGGKESCDFLGSGGFHSTEAEHHVCSNFFHFQIICCKTGRLNVNVRINPILTLC